MASLVHYRMMPPPTNTPDEPPRVIAGRRNSSGLSRDIEIIEVLGGAEAAASDGLGVVRVAQLTGRDKTVVSRSLATLADAGLVDRDPRSLNYRLGSRVFALAARSAESALASRARPLIHRIAHSTRETTHLCVLRGGNVLTVLSALSPPRVSFHGVGGGHDRRVAYPLGSSAHQRLGPRITPCMVRRARA